MKHQRIIKELLHMFFVELKPIANIRDIYDINYLVQLKVKF